MTGKKIIVIGGGASGLMAAGQAAELGAEVLLLEKMRRPACKLSITGKGRCNLTNIAPVPDFISHFGPGGRFLRQAFSRFFSSDLIAFFEDLNIRTITERGGRVFPENRDARDVADRLSQWTKDAGVKLITDNPVNALIIENNKASGVRSIKNRSYGADAVIIATGGASYPGTGSTGDGYKLAESAGHHIIPIRPALVPVDSDNPYIGQMEGLSLRNINVTLYIDVKKKADAFGEMEFTRTGLSGPVILTLSRQIVDALQQKKTVRISIDLKPALDIKKLDARLLRDLGKGGKKSFGTLLAGLLPKKLIPVCCGTLGIPEEKALNQITSGERKKIRTWLKSFDINITGHRSFSESIITAGGVDTNEINPRTMESLLMKNLYFAGEVLDIDADTGGYNLQAAFSTGWLAGRSAAGDEIK